MTQHHIGVIGGSGLYELDGLSDLHEVAQETTFGSPSDAVVVGRLEETTFYFLPRHGKGHRLPPHRINYRANILALKAAGATQLVSVSAVGSLQEDVHPGDVVLVDQFIDRTRSRASTFFDDDGVVAHVGFADPTDAALRDCLGSAAEAAGARVHRGGTYVCMEGPQFSTRAESHMYRSFGAKVIGMTNLTEAKLAREAQLPYATVAMVTDYDCWHDSEEDVTVEAVIALLKKNVELGRRMLRNVKAWPDPARSPAVSALRDAVLTPPAAISEAARNKLALLLDGAS